GGPTDPGGIGSGMAIAVDGGNRVYVVGETTSTNFPVVNAAQPVIGGGNISGAPPDMFITVFQSNGASLFYSTYLGGSDFEDAFTDANGLRFGMAVDKFGDVYVTGQTFSFDYPETPGCDQTNYANVATFVAKINPAVPGLAGLIYSTVLAGTTDS